MKNIFEWYSQGVEEMRVAQMHDRGKTKYLIPIYILLQAGLYFYFKNSLSEHGAWVIVIPMLVVLTILVYIRWSQRNTPGTGGYHLFHLSKIVWIIVVLMVILAFYLFLYSQCQQYYLAINSVCLERIFIHGNK